MQTIHDLYRAKLRLLISEYGTQAAFAEAIDKSPAQVSQWLSEGDGPRARQMSPTTARYIEGKIGHPRGWMDQPIDDPGIEHRTYRGGSPLDEGPESAPAPLDGGGAMESEAGYALGAYVQIRRVRLQLSAGVSGFGVEYLADDEEEPLWFLRSFIAKQGWRPDKLLALKVKGRSMEPGLTEGDTVLINTASTDPKDGFAFAVNYEGEAVIKRLVRDAGQWWLVSDNPDQTRYPRKLCDEHVRIVGEVVQKQSLRI